MKIIERNKARLLRKTGKSINQIVKETGFSKASVSVWVRDIVLTETQKNKISERGRSVDSIEKRRLNRLFNENKKRQFGIDEASKDIKGISMEDLRLIGVSLYLGEGAKKKRGVISIANSDPVIIKIMMKFFREICLVPENKFRGHIHTFSHADINKTEKYWSNITGISQKQFFKTYTKQSSASLQKRHTLPFGTFDIYVCDIKVWFKIFGWIKKIQLLTVGL